MKKFRLNAKVLGGGKCSMLAEGDIDLTKLVPAEGMTVRKQSPTKADFIFYVDGVPVDLSISKVGDPEEEACQCRDRPFPAPQRQQGTVRIHPLRWRLGRFGVVSRRYKINSE